MSVEAPQQVVDELPVENTTDVVPRRALLESSGDTSLGDDTEAEPKRAFEMPQTEPVSPEDAENRYADHEILGKSVRVKLSIIETAKNAVSVSDETLAEGLNRLSPRAAWRKFRLDRAQKSLNSKKDRLSSKHQKAQESYEEHKKKLESRLEKKKTADQEKWVDGVTSTRLRERRQEKVDAKHQKRSDRMQSKLESHKKRIDGKHAKRSAKVEDYKKDTYESRKKNILILGKRISDARRRLGLVRKSAKVASSKIANKQSKEESSLSRAKNCGLCFVAQKTGRRAKKRERCLLKFLETVMRLQASKHCAVLLMRW